MAPRNSSAAAAVAPLELGPALGVGAQRAERRRGHVLVLGNGGRQGLALGVERACDASPHGIEHARHLASRRGLLDRGNGRSRQGRDDAHFDCWPIPGPATDPVITARMPPSRSAASRADVASSAESGARRMYPRTLFTRSGVATTKARVLVTASVTARSTSWPALASPDVFSNDATSTRSGPLAATVPVRRNGTAPASHAATPTVATATAAATAHVVRRTRAPVGTALRPARRHRVPRPSRRPSETARDRSECRGRRRTRGPAAGPSAPPTTTCAGPHDGARAPRAGFARYREGPCQPVEQQHAERVDVAARRLGSAVQDLGCEVERRSRKRRAPGESVRARSPRAAPPCRSP